MYGVSHERIRKVSFPDLMSLPSLMPTVVTTLHVPEPVKDCGRVESMSQLQCRVATAACLQSPTLIGFVPAIMKCKCVRLWATVLIPACAAGREERYPAAAVTSPAGRH